MRAAIAFCLAIVFIAFAAASAVGPAMAAEGRGVAPTSNPGGNNYYFAPRLAASPMYEYVYAACQVQGLGYGEAIVVDGHAFPCP
jgi:hypothetical protein